jgi:hypothetical protein
MIKIKVEALRKGQYITPKRLEKVLNADSESQKYHLRFFELKKRIQKESAENGYPLLVRQEHNGLRIMTDVEALQYKTALNRRTTHRLSGIHNELHRVSRKSLPRKEQKLLRVEKSFQADVLEAIRTVMEE